MHAVIVTIDMSGTAAELKPFLDSYSRSLASCQGLVSHVWLRDAKNVGLFHVFETEEAAKRYLNSGLLSMLTAHPACTGHAFVRRFDVVGASAGERAADLPLAEIEALGAVAHEVMANA